MTYVTEVFYERLVEDFAGFERGENPDRSIEHEIQRLLTLEARLLDQRRFDDWLSLYAGECLYWVPASTGAGDPRREVAVAFDDRRRIEDRLYRLGTGSAWSQAPASRTVHMLSNVEVFKRNSAVLSRSSFLVTEFRAGETHRWSGWYAHRLRRDAGGWKIEVKQVNLIDCDQNLRNPSLVL